MGEITNRFGRQWGRGWRPYFLIPKVLAVIAFGGGLLAASVLLHTRPGEAEAAAPTLRAVRTVFHWLIIPGGLAAVTLGVCLLIPHAGILLRARWLRAKLVLVALGLPTAHLLGRLAMDRLAAQIDANPAEADFRPLTLVVDATILLAVLLVVFGRQKPRLGEAYGTRRTGR